VDLLDALRELNEKLRPDEVLYRVTRGATGM
jgi:hypothetical protein